MNSPAANHRFILKITLVLLFFLLLLFLQHISPALAGDASLTWNPNTETDMAGYRVYYGTTTPNYGTSVDVGNQTTYTVTGLAAGTYYFAVTAYDTAGNESAYSIEVSKTFTTQDTTPPVLSAIAAGGITSTSAVITWTTDEAADTQIQYGTTTAYGSSSSLNTTPVALHSQTLTALLSSTLYHFRVLSRDAAGNLAMSGNNTFTTGAAPDTAPPVISGITIGSITGTGAAVSWTTNEPSDTQVQYGTTTAYGSSTALNTAGVTSHSQSLTGLQGSMLYHVRVLSRDAAGNLATSGDYTFTTLPVLDTTPPVISGITASNITNGSAVIAWTTDEAATSQVEYGTSTVYGSSTALNSALVTGHSITLTGLAASTVYHYRVISADAAGNLVVSVDNTFIASAALDTTAPVVSAISAGNITAAGTTITWTTNEAATSQVEYGTTTAYGSSTALNSTPVTGHSVTLTGLAASAVYHYRVMSADAAGNLAASGDNTFTTSAAPDTTGPVFSLITVGNITDSGAAISWGTDEPATTQIEYGPTTAYGSSSPINAALLNGHSQTVTGLLSSTLYHYRVKSADAAGNLSVSGDQIFTTLAAPDTTPPADISNFRAVSGNRQVVLSWINPADSDFIGVRIRYRTDHFPVDINDGELLGDFTGDLNKAANTTHAGLQNGVTYYYSASSYDGQGNYQTTAHASASPIPADSPDTTLSGGCGMVHPIDGKPSGPGRAADMMILFAIILIAITKRELRRKKVFDKISLVSSIICILVAQDLKRKNLEDASLVTRRRTIFNETIGPSPYNYRYAYDPVHGS